ncbi:kinase-like protein [Piedraia hortae CBS 480.64]|uniref:non-specific serine/threonine protein kinase n=1 Tax=Piedraia hortae CBS 480.64 TaxID=1314780 RepID=A0A6A7C804_9PEZI|nr:kinase-like protein [Piedraia hortae CBS 480.64]
MSHQPAALTQLSHYLLDTLWQLAQCFTCFPRSPRIAIRGQKYTILRLLGEGGFSYVYLVSTPEDPGTYYALKKIRCSLGEESLSRAQKEVEAYRLFDHPNIIPVVDWEVDRDKETVYILLPYYRRGNLQDMINANLVNGAKVPERRLLGLFLGVCQALKELHQYNPKKKKRARPSSDAEEDEGGLAKPLMEGEAEDAPVKSYAHRDIKPSNIMISDSGTFPVLMDMGSLARSPVTPSNRSLALQLQDEAAELCTMPYRAPELFDVKTGVPVTTAVDIWSLGCTLYACLVGKSPFEARSEESGGSLSLCVLNGDWRFPDEGTSGKKRASKSEADRGISEGVKDIVRACLRVEPERRPNVDELADLIQGVMDQLGED